MSDTESHVWMDQPAREWLSALPVGNGRLGAMVFGQVHKELIWLNEETVWTRQNPDRLNPGAAEHIAEVRDLLLAGRPLDAQFVAEYSMFGRPHYQATYQTLGTLKLLVNGHHVEHASDYRRGLDIEAGIAFVSYRIGDVTYRREVLASAVDDVIVVRLSSSTRTAVRVALNLYRKQDSVGRCLDERTMELTGRAGSRGTRFAATGRVLAGGADVEAVGDHLHIRGADEVTILIGVATDFRHEDFQREALAAVERASRRDYDQIRSAHIDEHRGKMARVTLDLGASPAAAQPTDARLKAVREGASDPDLVARFFQYGRYLLLGSSRPGTLPANLQGIWNEHYISAWDSKFTININTEMNYWPAEVTNLSECHEPLFDLIDRVRVSGAETARVHYRANGFVAHHNTDLWADTAPLDNVYCGLWLTGGAWLALHTWDHYTFTLDRTFLAERAYPTLREAATFLLDVMVPDDDGTLLLGPTLSPENGYLVAGVRAALCLSPAMDVQITRAILSRCLEAAEILGISDDWHDVVRGALDHLPPHQIGSDGRLLEWRTEVEECEPGHRHLSHLFGVYPDDQLIAEARPELIDAARRSLRARVDNIATSRGGLWGGWSAAWAALLWARLGDGDEALKLVELMLAVSTSDSLLDTSPPGGTNPLTVFQIDGNLGATAAIAEMLVQSHGGVVSLLPALPSAWARGSVTGLRLRGGSEIDLAWQDGRLASAQIRAHADRPLTITAKHPFEVYAGAGTVTESSQGRASVVAGAGEKVIVTPIEKESA